MASASSPLGRPCCCPVTPLQSDVQMLMLMLHSFWQALLLHRASNLHSNLPSFQPHYKLGSCWLSVLIWIITHAAVESVESYLGSFDGQKGLQGLYPTGNMPPSVASSLTSSLSFSSFYHPQLSATGLCCQITSAHIFSVTVRVQAAAQVGVQGLPRVDGPGRWQAGIRHLRAEWPAEGRSEEGSEKGD